MNLKEIAVAQYGNKIKEDTMKKYHKIQTLFERDPETKYKTLLEGHYSKPEFKMLKDITWTATEKIDGANIRVGWDGKSVTFGGRTDNAQVPTFLFKRLQEIFIPGLMTDVFGEYQVTLYGEGFGAKIQSGGKYIPDGCDFILFDILSHYRGENHDQDLWMCRRDVNENADQLGIQKVPILGMMPLDTWVDMVKQGFDSTIAKERRPAEGMVLRPKLELVDREGDRIITKLKCKDFFTPAPDDKEV